MCKHPRPNDIADIWKAILLIPRHSHHRLINIKVPLLIALDPVPAYYTEYNVDWDQYSF